MAKNLHRQAWLLRILRITLACLLLAGLAWYLDPAHLVSQLGAMDGGVLWISLVFGALGIAVQLAKWHCLLVYVRPGTSWSEGLRSLLAGFGLGMVSPGRVGELGRGVVFEGDQGTWIGLSAADRACSAAISLLLGWCALVVLQPTLALGVAGIAGGLAGGGLALAPRLGARFGSLDGWRQGWAALRGIDRWTWLKVALWSLIFNLLFFVQFYLLLSSWGQLPPGAVWGVPMFFALKLLLPFTPMDIGVREAAALMVFTPLGLEPALAFNAAFVQFAINVVMPGIGGWAMLYSRFSRELGWRKPFSGW